MQANRLIVGHRYRMIVASYNYAETPEHIVTFTGMSTALVARGLACVRQGDSHMLCHPRYLESLPSVIVARPGRDGRATTHERAEGNRTRCGLTYDPATAVAGALAITCRRCNK